MPEINPEEIWRRTTGGEPNMDWKRTVGLIALVIIVIVVVWVLYTSFYTVSSNARGVVRRFGKVIKVTQPGLHFKFPWPIDEVDTPKVEEYKRIEVGFRTVRLQPQAQYRSVPEESLMLGGDTNIVDLDFVVQFRITDAVKYLFEVDDVDGAVKDAAEAAIRQVVGDSEIDDILTTEKTAVALKAQEIIQEIVDLYGCGVQIVAVQLQDVYPPEPVRPAFADVNSAREQKNQMINEAEAYKEREVPGAKGRAAKILREAEAYKEQQIKLAQGEAARFRSLLEEYRKAPEITRERLYIETMEEILPSMKKYVVDSEESGLLKLLPLQEGGATK